MVHGLPLVSRHVKMRFLAHQAATAFGFFVPASFASSSNVAITVNLIQSQIVFMLPKEHGDTGPHAVPSFLKLLA